jgi:hypothetical protein
LGIPIGFPSFRKRYPRPSGKEKAAWAFVGPNRGSIEDPAFRSDTGTRDLKFKTGSRCSSFFPIAGDREHDSDKPRTSAKSASNTRCPFSLPNDLKLAGPLVTKFELPSPAAKGLSGVYLLCLAANQIRMRDQQLPCHARSDGPWPLRHRRCACSVVPTRRLHLRPRRQWQDSTRGRRASYTHNHLASRKIHIRGGRIIVGAHIVNQGPKAGAMTYFQEDR